MSADRLLAQFDRLSEAPDAVPQLRRFILDLATRGKLVEQVPSEDPASHLIELISAEKTRLRNDQRLRKAKQLPPLEREEIPFECPREWEWVRIRDVTEGRGQTTPAAEFTYIDVTAIDKEAGRITAAQVLSPSAAPSRARKIVAHGDVLYSCVRPYLLNIAVIETTIDPPPIASTAFAVLNGFGLVVPRYIWIVLRSPSMVASVTEKMRGQAYPAINDSDFAMLPFPLPPLAEQHRIVAKVNELMAACDELEAAQVERDRRRGRLALASMAELNKGGRRSVGSRSEEARYLANFASWLTTTKYINALRQAVRDAALQGRLVRQDEADGSAAEAVEQAYQHREEAFASGRLKPISHIPIDADLAQWPIPNCWLAAPLPAVIYFQEGPGLRNWQFRQKGIPFLNIRTLQDGKVNRALCQFLDPDEVETKYRHFLVREGDILCSTSGTIGKLAVATAGDLPLMLNTSIVRFSPYGGGVPLAGYIKLFLESGCFLQQASRSITGSAQVNMGPSHLKRMAFPVPPLAEQRRIVAKVDELMSTCDQLEQSLVAVETSRARLLRSVLYDALAEGGGNPRVF